MKSLSLTAALALSLFGAQADIANVVNSIKNHSYKVRGYFANYGNGAYDWLYLSAEGALYKLDGATKNGYLQWMPLSSYLSANLINKKIAIGSPKTPPPLKTITCKDKMPGSSFTINKVTYKVVDDTSLRAMNPNKDDYEHICTSHISDMSELFRNALHFNQDISQWDTSSVEDMSGMFDGAVSFNQPLNSWNTASVTNMSAMFSNAVHFNQPLNKWNTANVVDMSAIFENAISFNQNISSWCVPKIVVKPINFDTGAAFEGENYKQQKWDTCP